MAQGILPFKYENDKQNNKMTGFGGPAYLDLVQAARLPSSIDRHLNAGSDSQGWTDSQVVMSLILLNLIGGDCVEDLNCLERDEGLCSLIKSTEKHGMSRKQRRAFLRRWRKERKRTAPSPSAVFRYLSWFHDKEQNKLRETGKAFIPEPNEHLKGLAGVNKDFLSFVQKHNRQRTATLDMDATLVEKNKSEALSCLPEGVKEVILRSDTAGYQHDLMRYCATGRNKRFGIIKFAIGCDVTPEFKKAVLEVSDSIS